MNNVITLKDVNLNQSCLIKKINATGVMRRRLMDIGMVPGTEVFCILTSFSGNPKAYLVKGSVIALRNDDAGMIEVNLL